MTCREKTYIGTREDRPGGLAWDRVSVTVSDNHTRQVDTLEHHVKHSPTGFSWGYHGSGPAELARCILWDHLHAEPAPAVYQDFKSDVVARFETDEWRVSTAEVEGWLQRWLDAHPDGAVTVGQQKFADEVVAHGRDH